MSRVNRILNCPYCDEESQKQIGKRSLITPDKIYTPRICIMGHTFYSVEYIPDNQDEIQSEIKEIRSQWRIKNGKALERVGMEIKVNDT